MPAKNNNRQPVAQAPPPAAPKATAKYTNKDGTKYISVPKSSASTPPAQPSPTTTSSSRGGAPTNPPPSTDAPPAPPVNRKKQKRRAKAAAKAAAEQAEAAANGLPSPASTSSAPLPTAAESQKKDSHSSRNNVPSEVHVAHNHHDHHHHHHVHNGEDWGDETESDDEIRFVHGLSQNSNSSGWKSNSSKKAKKKKQKKGTNEEPVDTAPSGISREKIWNTSGPEERERIKQFWLGLGEDERKSLVKVEKDAVLKKMKEQQKHTCSCSVCGRKRTAIEEELEGLYDAYYQELESFANQPHNHPNAPPMFSPKRFGPASGLHPPGILPSTYSNHHPSHGRIVEHVDNDEDEEEDVEEYSDVDGLDDEDEDEDEPDEEIPRDSYPNDFFNFGQSLQVKGGILTVADDLLKNDGKKFIEMMEQLAERRMAREEDAKDHYAGGYGHVNGNSLPNPHNHPPPEDDDYEEEEEEEDYDSQEDEDYEEEEDTMTEEQRMEEGRRMFQIFAARMFEQRVLTAYREKVARERQEKLLEELEQEETQESQRKAKKAKEAQKKKDKAAQKKQAQLEEKAKRDAAKAAEDAARLAEEARKSEEAKLRAEEKRKKKDAQKKAEEEERIRKEAERQRRAQEQKEKQQEQERKAREAKEREKKLKEEQRRKEQEARELKERETRERREKHEKDKRDKELRAAQAKAERDAKEKSKQEEKEKAAARSAPPATPIPTQPSKKQHPVSIPALPHQPLTSHPSPQVAVATPALPKAPTPMKARSASQEVTRSASQASQSASGPSQNVSPHTLTPLHTSPGPIGPPRKASSNGPTSAGPPGPKPASPPHVGIRSPFVSHQGPFGMGPPLGMQYGPGMAPPPPPPPPPGFRMQDHMFPPAANFRPGAPMPPPGFGAPSPMGGRPFPIPHAPPGFHQPAEQPTPVMHHQGFSPDSVSGQLPTHSRQASASFDPSPLASSISQPISRPAPIGRPGSVVHGQKGHDLSSDIDDVNHLGSSALLDDTDDPFEGMNPSRRGTAPPGSRPPFPSAPFMESFIGSPMNTTWAPNPFSPPPGFANPAWPPNPTFGEPAPRMRGSLPRSVTVRQTLVSTCKELEVHAADPDGYISLSDIKAHVDSVGVPGHDSITEKELEDICETEGNAQNGGGSFDIRRDENGKVAIRFQADKGSPSAPFPRSVGARAPGEIGSPIVGTGSPHHTAPGSYSA
ncbi:salt tolerance down-regulator-domain-containing protein [Hypomontagnella submonticulosa]|nr:salt tolerance down-regulator-domain-containing protein [Hypomontagnella submonticulosa]